MMHWQPLTEHNRRSYVNYIRNETPLIEVESLFIKRRDDLITLAGDLQDGWLGSKLGYLANRRWPRLAAVSTILHPLAAALNARLHRC